MAFVDIADLQGSTSDKLDILRLACGQCSLEAALPDEEHETEQINRHKRDHGIGLHADDAYLFGERAGKESDIMQRVYDASEEAVDEHGVDAAIARCLRALDHHESDCHAVHRIQDGGLPSSVASAAKRKHEKRGDEQREGDAVGVGHVHVDILELPEHQNADACNQASRHGQQIHKAADPRIANCKRAHDAGAECDGADAQGAVPVIAQHAAIHLRVLARNVLEHGLPQVDLAAFQHDGEREQRHEHQRDEECGHGLRDGVQREIQKGAIGGAKDQIMVAVVRVEAGEQALPQHVEAGRPQA